MVYLNYHSELLLMCACVPSVSLSIYLCLYRGVMVCCNIIHNDGIGRRELTEVQQSVEGEAIDMTVLMMRTKVMM